MGQSPEDLGLRPELSRLPSEMRDLIQHGNRDGHGGSEAAVKVCAAMFCADYRVDEFWMVMIDPIYGISKLFFEKDGVQGEAWLEWIVCEAY